MSRRIKRVFCDLDTNARTDLKCPSKFIPVEDGQENINKKPRLEFSAVCIKKPEKLERISKVRSTTSPHACIVESEERPSAVISSAEDVIQINEFLLLTPELIESVMAVEMNPSRKLTLPEEYNKGNDGLNSARRELLLDWLIQIHSQLKLGNEVFHLAVILMDIFISSVDVSLDELQAVALAGLWLSHKYFYGAITAKSILKFGVVTRKQLISFEKQLLLQADFNLQFSNSMTILMCLLYRVIGESIPKLIYYCCCYAVDLMFIHSNFIHDCLSMRVLTAVFTVLFLLQSPFRQTLWELFDLNTQKTVLDIHKRLIGTLTCVSRTSCCRKKSALYYKYSSSKYHNVSKLLSTNINLLTFEAER